MKLHVGKFATAAVNNMSTGNSLWGVSLSYDTIKDTIISRDFMIMFKLSAQGKHPDGGLRILIVYHITEQL